MSRADLDWQDDAACAGQGSEAWFPEGYQQRADAAKAVCNTVCEVRETCLRYAIGHEDPITGVWGGVNITLKNRPKLRKAMGFQ